MSTLNIVLSLLGVAGSLFGVWFKWKLNQAHKDRIAREMAEERAKHLQKALVKSYEQNAETKKLISEIDAGGVSDERANDIMRREPKADRKFSRSTSPKASKR